MSAIAQPLGRSDINAKSIALISTAAISFGVFLSGFVIDEPAPYELYMAGLIAIWAFCGFRLSRFTLPLLILLITFNLGGFVAMTQMAKLESTPLYLAVSLFLAFTAIFVASLLEQKPDLYRPLFTAWLVAAIPTALLGILGYFHAFPGAEVFTKYERAAGAFQDPNVFGPFLCLPGVYLLYRMLTEKPSRMFLYAVPLLIITGGIFLSFSRGAWGLFGVSAMLLTLMVFLQTPSNALRLRIVVMSGAAVVLLVVALLIALQIPSISELFTARAHIAQEYDSARLGRFARYSIGFQMALEHPLGIGPLVFGTIFGEDTHDIWLKALMDYGWIGFVSYLSLILWTLAAGFKILFRHRPWQPYLLCAYVVFLGHLGLGTVIDMDHWRHFYLLLGLIWGAIALEKRYQRGLLRVPTPGGAPRR